MHIQYPLRKQNKTSKNNPFPATCCWLIHTLQVGSFSMSHKSISIANIFAHKLTSCASNCRFEAKREFAITKPLHYQGTVSQREFAKRSLRFHTTTCDRSGYVWDDRLICFIFLRKTGGWGTSAITNGAKHSRTMLPVFGGNPSQHILATCPFYSRHPLPTKKMLQTFFALIITTPFPPRR